jgi:hypothetical protein
MLLAAPLVAVITAALHKQANQPATAMHEPTMKRSGEAPIKSRDGCKIHDNERVVRPDERHKVATFGNFTQESR